MVPVTPRLMAILQEAFDAAEGGQDRVVTLGRNNIAKRLLPSSSVPAWSGGRTCSRRTGDP